LQHSQTHSDATTGIIMNSSWVVRGAMTKAEPQVNKKEQCQLYFKDCFLKF